jgi:hypothetical protein
MSREQGYAENVPSWVTHDAGPLTNWWVADLSATYIETSLSSFLAVFTELLVRSGIIAWIQIKMVTVLNNVIFI